MDAKKRVAIIGAGISGLAAIKSCLEEGLEPVCFEQYDNIGGVWFYTEEYREGQGARAFDNLTTNISREMFSFSDFPFPSHLPPFLTCSMVHDYLQSYCENFGLGKHIHLNTKVINIRKSPDYKVSGRWEVETEDPQKTQRDIFDFVMICSGFYKKPRFPDVEGMDTFRGSFEHSMKFKDAARYKGMNVLVVGNSNSSGDLAAESARYAHQVYYSVGEAEFDDGTILKNLDAILFATGYHLAIDFLQESYKEDDGKLNLYKMTFPLWQHPTLSLVGCVDISESFPPITELQCRLVARVFAGSHKLPSMEVMANDVKKKNSFFLKKFGRYKYLMPTIIYRDELAAELGVAPSWWDLIKAGPRLAYQYYYGPAFPYYHRLWGPHAWRGAKDAINHALEHGHYAKQVRHVQGPDVEGSSFMLRFIIVSVLAVLLTMMYNG
ncbi:dimethylaniline monooxygenase [N-oxide-forming] 2-like [Haliotis rufescens]|uniref:dimethylaniline monooxygenase [N-oxide-forming] 2-like n=1 Tax=Haliotis rufescens TaxID=6454 RepID=UPI00201ED0FD|nr:dimethylaniline monooxygenase [N-oxide-forming] 2-like [Haliotis rufescens]